METGILLGFFLYLILVVLMIYDLRDNGETRRMFYWLTFFWPVAAVVGVVGIVIFGVCYFVFSILETFAWMLGLKKDLTKIK